jgi:hypothetical protein
VSTTALSLLGFKSPPLSSGAGVLLPASPASGDRRSIGAQPDANRRTSR